jgi:hypothetical protein
MGRGAASALRSLPLDTVRTAAMMRIKSTTPIARPITIEKILVVLGAADSWRFCGAAGALEENQLIYLFTR